MIFICPMYLTQSTSTYTLISEYLISKCVMVSARLVLVIARMPPVLEEGVMTRSMCLVKPSDGRADASVQWGKSMSEFELSAFRRGRLAFFLRSTIVRSPYHSLTRNSTCIGSKLCRSSSKTYEYIKFSAPTPMSEKPS